MPKRVVFKRSRRELSFNVSVGVLILLVVEQSSLESQSTGCDKTCEPRCTRALCRAIIVIVVVFTLKTVLTSIQYLLFLTIQGKETNFRDHKPTQNKVQKNKSQRKSQYEKI